MRNITKLILESENHSLSEKIHALLDPDRYVVDNIADYRENIPNFSFPWYKSLRAPWDIIEERQRVNITIYNVGLKPVLKNQDLSQSGFFHVYDSSGGEIMYWYEKGNGFWPPLVAANETQWIRGDDWVYSLTFTYFININLPVIADVFKYKPPKEKIKNKLTLRDRLNELLPEPEPLFQPS